MEEGSFGQSPSLGSSTVMIPPQTTTTYTNMTFNNNKEKPLTAQLIYAYKLNCSSTNGNGSNGINTTESDNTTSTGVYSSSSTDSLSNSYTGSLPSPTGSPSTSSASPSTSSASQGIMIKSKHCNH